MAKNNLNLETYRGDDFSLTLSVKDINGPINITDWVFYFTIKSKTSDLDEDALLKKDVIVHTNPTEGLTTIALTNAETNGLAGVFQYDVQFKTDADIVKTALRGTIKFIDDVTRRIIPE